MNTFILIGIWMSLFNIAFNLFELNKRLLEIEEVKLAAEVSDYSERVMEWFAILDHKLGLDILNVSDISDLPFKSEDIDLMISKLGIVENAFDLIQINLSGSYYGFSKMRGNISNFKFHLEEAEVDQDLILLTAKIEKQAIDLINLIKPEINL